MFHDLDIVKLPCHFVSFVDKVIKPFQGGGDKKRNVCFPLFCLTPGNVCPQAVTLNSVT